MSRGQRGGGNWGIKETVPEETLEICRVLTREGGEESALSRKSPGQGLRGKTAPCLQEQWSRQCVMEVGQTAETKGHSQKCLLLTVGSEKSVLSGAAGSKTGSSFKN